MSTRNASSSEGKKRKNPPALKPVQNRTPERDHTSDLVHNASTCSQDSPRTKRQKRRIRLKKLEMQDETGEDPGSGAFDPCTQIRSNSRLFQTSGEEDNNANEIEDPPQQQQESFFQQNMRRTPYTSRHPKPPELRHVEIAGSALRPGGSSQSARGETSGSRSGRRVAASSSSTDKPSLPDISNKRPSQDDGAVEEEDEAPKEAEPSEEMKRLLTPATPREARGVTPADVQSALFFRQHESETPTERLKRQYKNWKPRNKESARGSSQRRSNPHHEKEDLGQAPIYDDGEEELKLPPFFPLAQARILLGDGDANGVRVRYALGSSRWATEKTALVAKRREFLSPGASWPDRVKFREQQRMEQKAKLTPAPPPTDSILKHEVSESDQDESEGGVQEDPPKEAPPSRSGGSRRGETVSRGGSSTRRRQQQQSLERQMSSDEDSVDEEKELARRKQAGKDQVKVDFLPESEVFSRMVDKGVKYNIGKSKVPKHRVLFWNVPEDYQPPSHRSTRTYRHHSTSIPVPGRAGPQTAAERLKEARKVGKEQNVLKRRIEQQVEIVEEEAFKRECTQKAERREIKAWRAELDDIETAERERLRKIKEMRILRKKQCKRHEADETVMRTVNTKSEADIWERTLSRFHDDTKRKLRQEAERKERDARLAEKKQKEAELIKIDKEQDKERREQRLPEEGREFAELQRLFADESQQLQLLLEVEAESKSIASDERKCFAHLKNDQKNDLARIDGEIDAAKKAEEEAAAAKKAEEDAAAAKKAEEDAAAKKAEEEEAATAKKAGEEAAAAQKAEEEAAAAKKAEEEAATAKKAEEEAAAAQNAEEEAAAAKKAEEDAAAAKKAEEDAVEEEKASVVIQNVHRRNQSIADTNTRLADRNQKLAEAEAAAEVERRKKEAEAEAARQKFREKRSARIIQNAERNRQSLARAKKLVAEKKEKEKDASQLEEQHRGERQNLELDEQQAREAAETEELESSAKLIQEHDASLQKVRAVEYRKEGQAATRIQAIQRGRMERQRIARWKEDEAAAKKKAEANRLVDEERKRALATGDLVAVREARIRQLRREKEEEEARESELASSQRQREKEEEAAQAPPDELEELCKKWVNDLTNHYLHLDELGSSATEEDIREYAGRRLMFSMELSNYKRLNPDPLKSLRRRSSVGAPLSPGASGRRRSSIGRSLHRRTHSEAVRYERMTNLFRPFIEILVRDTDKNRANITLMNCLFNDLRERVDYSEIVGSQELYFDACVDGSANYLDIFLSLTGTVVSKATARKIVETSLAHVQCIPLLKSVLNHSDTLHIADSAPDMGYDWQEAFEKIASKSRLAKSKSGILIDNSAAMADRISVLQSMGEEEALGIDFATPSDEDGLSILHRACEEGDSQVVGLLLRHFADEQYEVVGEPSDDDQLTPLMFAVLSGSVPCVQMILDTFPDDDDLIGLNFINEEAGNALDIAVLEMKNKKMAKLLSARGLTSQSALIDELHDDDDDEHAGGADGGTIDYDDGYGGYGSAEFDGTGTYNNYSFGENQGGGDNTQYTAFGEGSGSDPIPPKDYGFGS